MALLSKRVSDMDKPVRCIVRGGRVEEEEEEEVFIRCLRQIYVNFKRAPMLKQFEDPQKIG